MVFKKSDLLWANRFDHYLKLGSGTVHLWQFLVAASTAAFFTFCVYLILRKTLSKDFDQVAVNRSAVREFRRRRAEAAYSQLSTTVHDEINDAGIELTSSSGRNSSGAGLQFS